MNKKSLITIIPFLMFIFIMGIVNIFYPDSLSSSTENRKLQQLPKIGEMPLKSFTSLYEKYYSDQFFCRNFLVMTDVGIKLKLGYSKINSTYITKDKYLLEDISSRNPNNMKDYGEKINLFSDKLSSKKKKLIIVSAPAKDNALRFKISNEYKDTLIDKSLDVLDKSIDKEKVDFINLDKHFKSNYTFDQLSSFYIKTDHHWNMSGGYEGFKNIINSMNNKNYLDVKIDDEDYEKSVFKNKSFNGSRNRNLFYLVNFKDDIPLIFRKEKSKYEINEIDSDDEICLKDHINDNNFKKVNQKDVYARDLKSEKFNYDSVYVGGVACRKIVNNNSLSDKKLIVFRDSYESAVEWLLADVFREVVVVDNRYIKDESMDIIDLFESDFVMTIFNSNTINSMLAQFL